VSFITLYFNLLPVFFGALVGSFLNVVIIRWPEERSFVGGRSSCPRCDLQIAWYDNIPIISFTLLRGRCRGCKAPISWRYPAVEAVTALLAWLTFRRMIPDLNHIEKVQVAGFLLYFGFVAGLIAITVIDFEHYLIPDIISLPSIPIGIVGAFVLEWAGGGIITGKSAVLGAILGGGFLMLLRVVYQLIRKQEGMGLGDVKMLAMLGAFLGHHPALLFIIFVSSFLGSISGILMMVIKGKDLKYALPFGPFLAIAGLLYLLWGYTVAPLFIPTVTPILSLPSAVH